MYFYFYFNALDKDRRISHTKSYNISVTQLTRELRACPNPTVEVWVI